MLVSSTESRKVYRLPHFGGEPQDAAPLAVEEIVRKRLFDLEAGIAGDRPRRCPDQRDAASSRRPRKRNPSRSLPGST